VARSTRSRHPEPYLYPRGMRRPTASDAVLPPYPIYRFTVRQLIDMVDANILGKYDRVELFDGWVVPKYSQTPMHAHAANTLLQHLVGTMGDAWWTRFRAAIITRRSVFEPDIALVPDHPSYGNSWPHAKVAQLVAEVSDIELARDRDYKLPRYASAGVPTYWIVNLIDQRIEVYSKPVGGRRPTYAMRRDYLHGEDVPVHVNGKKATSINASELLPLEDRARRK